MGTAPRKGFNLAKSVGSGCNSAGLTEHSIASGYATALGAGDPVKLHTDGTLIKATNGADAMGIFEQVRYTNAQGEIKIDNYLPASTVSADMKALVSDNPTNTYTILADGPIPLAQVGHIYAMNLSAADAATGRSTDTANTIPTITGDVDISAMTDLPTDIAALTANDAFTIQTTDPDNSAVTIVVEAGDAPADLIAKLDAVTGIDASLDGSGFLQIQTTDGYYITTVETVGNVITDLFAVASHTAAGTKVVAANAGLLKVISIPDRANKQFEAVIVNHSLRDDG